VNETDFKQDVFIGQIWLANVATGRTVQLTRGDKPSGLPVWSPDSQYLALTSTRVRDRNQLSHCSASSTAGRPASIVRRSSPISVGAGISNWATYYYNTDITPFTINYLGDDPADAPEIEAELR
jgi:Tol biopolymer transport system component